MMLTNISKKIKLTGALLVIILVCLAVVSIVLLSKKHTSKANFAKTTNHITVKTYSIGSLRPPAPRPSILPPLIASTGECKNSMDRIRALFTKYPSGLNLDRAGHDALNAGLASLNKTCSLQLAYNFSQQELLPWENYSIPITSMQVPSAHPTVSESKKVK